MATSAKDIIPLRYKVTRRFYEPLLLLDALDSIRGGRIKHKIVSDDTETNHTKVRRDFSDTIACICAYKKEPDYVTATALEKTPQGVVVWLAANAKVEDKVVNFLKAVLVHVQKVAEQDDAENRQQAAMSAMEKLSSEITSFHSPRLEVYVSTITKNVIKPCQDVLTEYCNNGKSLR
jgi:hypothetical protein